MWARGSSDPLVPLDLAVLLQQAGQSVEATSVFERANEPNPPSYALLAVVRAYRDQKRYDRAEALAREGLWRFPNETVWPILLGLVMADAGKGEAALTVLASPAGRRAPLLERLLAQGYAANRAGRQFEALRYYSDAAQRDPSNVEARNSLDAILRQLRAPWAAARLAAKPSPLGLQADLAAASVRWAEQDKPYDPQHRFDRTDRALADLDRLIAAAGDDQALLTRLRFDRIVALHDRVRMAEVVREAESMRQAGIELPAYVRQALADALLHLRRPKAAREEYEDVLKSESLDADQRNAAQVGQIYACVEMEDFAAAYAQADLLAATEPIWRRDVGDPTPYPRDQWLEALMLAGSVRLYGDQPAEAWSRIEPDLAAAPANVSVRLNAAAIMQARDWPRAAEQENRIALSLAPDLAAAQIAVADLALARHRYAEARQRIAALVATYPEDLQVQSLRRQLAADTGWLLETEARPANERGGGAFGNNGNEMVASIRITSPLIGDNWRLFAGYDYANAHPPEGYVDRQRAAFGLQFLSPDLAATVSVHQDFGTLARTGASGTLDWGPSDHLSFGLAADYISIETPLRALLFGISANSVNARATYTWNESRNVTFSAAWLPFTDGNQRFVLDTRFTQKVIAVPHFGLAVFAELYGSNNSQIGAPYYNPSADGSGVIGLQAEHVTWRRYDRSFVQAVTLEGGWYGERDFKGGPIGTAVYEHRWTFNPWTELRYGVSIGERLYDGQGARVLGLFITLRQHL
jgi:biofilm PGA synthesis protein PgaA